MLNKLETIDKMGYPYYFQFTITPYGQHVEKGLPGKSEILETFKKLSDKIGKHRFVWRYDPVIASKEFSVEYHLDAFSKMCNILGDYTNNCIFSFIDLYKNVQKSTKGIVDYEVNNLEMNRFALGFFQIAKTHNLVLETCAESIDLSPCGVLHASCIDLNRIENIIGYPLHGKKDPNQRPACSCIESIDIGAYDSCSHSCAYCYATTSENMVRRNMHLHDPQSPMLVGHPRGDEILTSRQMKSLKVMQSLLF
jgi:hypothetical protein